MKKPPFSHTWKQYGGIFTNKSLFFCYVIAYCVSNATQ